MDVKELPDDVLHAIFRELPGIAALRCRQVCIRWQEAVDSLSDKDWKKICSNEAMYEDYEAAHSKYGMSWRETYKAINSWRRIGSFEMSSQELCDKVEFFKVLPKGIVACLQNKRHQECYGSSDTIVYYNTDTFQDCGKEEFDFAFYSASYEENEHFKVLIRCDCDLCIIVNETKKLFVVGAFINTELFYQLGRFTVIGKEVYFKNCNDDIIYVSKLIKKKGIPTIKTKPLEAFLENHSSYEEDIIAFAIKDGNVVILSDEGNKGNIYIHENADLGWANQFAYDQGDIYIGLQEYNLNWKSPAIYYWLSSCTNLSSKPVFYSHGNIYLTTRSYGKTICIHYCPYYIYAPDHLLKVLQGKPNRRISTKELIPNEKTLNQRSYIVSQLDIIETPTSHKVLVKLGDKLFVIEFTPGQKDFSSQSIKTAQLKLATKNKKLQVKRTSTPTYKTAKKLVRERKTSAKKGKIENGNNMQAKRKRSGTLSHKHPYSTRSSSK